MDPSTSKYTECARRVIHLTKEAPVVVDHGYTGTEHLLLAFVWEGNGVAGRLLTERGATLEKMKETVFLFSGSEARVTQSPSAYTPLMKRVLALAPEIAKEHHHDFVGTEHLLLALLIEGGGHAFGALNLLRIDPLELQDRIMEIFERAASYHYESPSENI